MGGGYIGNKTSIDLGARYYTKKEVDSSFYKIGDNTGVIHTTRLIGSSSKRSYTLSRTPESKNNTQVFINGIYQNKETYNITGDVLTLSESPENGFEIEVIIISSHLYSDQDDSAHNLTYNPVTGAESGSIVISIEDKLRTITGFVDHAKQDTLISNMYEVTGIHNSVLFVSGFWEIGDGGGGIFFWDSNIEKSRHNGGTVIDPDKCVHIQPGVIVDNYFSPSNSGYGCWLRVYKDTPSVKWFGAKGNDIDDTVAITHAIKYSETLEFPGGIYTSAEIHIETNTNLILDKNATLKLKNNSNKRLLYINEDVGNFSMIGGLVDGNRLNQITKKNLIVSESGYSTFSDMVFKNASQFAIRSSNITRVSNCIITDSESGISISPSRIDYDTQLAIIDNKLSVENTGIEVLKSADNISRYRSVIIENNQVITQNINESNVYITSRSGLRYTGNHCIGGWRCYFQDGNGGIISGNIFENQRIGMQIDNYSSLDVSDNQLRGEENGKIGIEHGALSQNYNNIFNSNHIQGYDIAVAKITDINNKVMFLNNVCHDAPIIIENSCGFTISNNKFSNSDTSIRLLGSTCDIQNGIINNNVFSTVGICIALNPTPGKEVKQVSIQNNSFSSVGTCILHDKSTGNIEYISIVGNTFIGVLELLNSPTDSDFPTSLLWKDNRGDTININATTNLPYGQIIYGERFVLNDVGGLHVPVGNNSHAIGQQLKISYYGHLNQVSLFVPNHSIPNSTFNFDSDNRYLVLEWSGNQWEDVTSRAATFNVPGIISIATFEECRDGVIETKAVAPFGLKGLLNDDTIVETHGWSSYKIDNEINTRITQAIQDIPYATTTKSGVIKLATLTECEDGTNSYKAVTPVGLRGIIDDNVVVTIKTWSSEKIQNFVEEMNGVRLVEESHIHDQCPVLFTKTPQQDRILDVNMSPMSLYYVPNRGSLNAVSFNSLSDKRYKNNIETIHDPMNIIDNIRGVHFNWKHNNEKSYGVIAQELEKIIPDLVSTSSETGIKTVNYDGLVGILLEAIKILKNRE